MEINKIRNAIRTATKTVICPSSPLVRSSGLTELRSPAPGVLSICMLCLLRMQTRWNTHSRFPEHKTSIALKRSKYLINFNC